MPKTKNNKDPLASILNENIPLSWAERERAAVIICTEISGAIDDNKDNISKAIECDDMYEGKTQKKNFPWKGASALWVPLAEWTVDAVFARIMAAFFSNAPHVRAEGRNAESAENADSVTELLDLVFTEVIRLSEKCRTIFKEAIKKPKSTCKLTWQRIIEPRRKIEIGLRFLIGDKEKDVSQEEAKGLIEQGIMPVDSTPRKIATQEDYELHNGPILEYIPYVYYITPANAILGVKPRFEAHLTPKTWQDILIKQKNEDYYSDAVDKLKEVEGGLSSGAETSESEEDIRNKELKGRNFLFDIAEYHGLYSFDNKSIDEAGEERSEKIEVEVVLTVERKHKILLAAKYPLTRPKLTRRCFYNTRYETSGNRFEGRGAIQKVENLNRALNNYYNHLINNAMMVMTKLFKRKRAVGDLDVDDPEIYPGAIVDVREMTDFEVMDMGDIKGVAVDIQGMVLKFAERLTAVTPWNLGTQAGKEGRGVTATEFSGIMGEANLNFSVTIENFVQTLKDICEDTTEFYYYNMPEAFERKTRKGESGFVISEKEEERVWDKEKFKGSFNFHWQITEDRGRNIERDIYILNNFINLPFMQKYLKKTWEMAKAVAISLNKKDWEKILPTEEEIDKEQRKIDLMGEAERVNLMKQHLIKKGYTPPEIESALDRAGIKAPIGA